MLGQPMRAVKITDR